MSKENIATQKTVWQKIFAWLYVIFPIKKHEWKKFLPISLLMASILFIYTLARNVKDALILTRATCGGAECLSAIKLFGVTTFAVVFMVVFNYLRNKFEANQIFYGTTSFFLAFFAVFAFVLYPNADKLHMSEATIRGLQSSVPFLSTLWPIIGNWSFSLFYIMSELWGSAVLSVLFWQFANQITKVSEAKRHYGLYALIANAIGGASAGKIISWSANVAIAKEAQGVSAADALGSNLRILITCSLIVGTLGMLIYAWMRKNVLTDPNLYDPSQVSKKKKKMKMGLMDSLKLIAHSPYILLIAVLVLSYGVSINLFEAVWKGQVKTLYPGANDYLSFDGKYSQATSLLTAIMTLLGTYIVRKTKWRTSAIITPLVILASAVVFFSVVIYKNRFGENAEIFGIRALVIAVMVGAIGNGISKSIKYTMFDSTKNMAYIPLDPELKTRGQAAVEAVGGRFGKAGGSMIQQILFAVTGITSLPTLVPVIGPIVLLVLVAWICSVCGLSKKFEALVAKNEAEEAAAAEVTEKVEATTSK